MDYNNIFPNITKGVQTVSDLDSSLIKKKTKGEGKGLSIFSVLIFIFAVIYFTQYRKIATLIPIPSIIIFSLYWFIAILLSANISVLCSTNLAEKRRNKTINAGSNDEFSLNSVWNIALGGLNESTPMKTKDYNDNTVSIKYDSNAILVKFLMDSVIDVNTDGDINHYLSLTALYDIIMKANFEIELITLRYNPDNDMIWDTSLKRISKASQTYGASYSLIRNKLENNLYEFTKQHSTVNVQYLLIKETPLSSVSPAQLLNTIIANLKLARVKLYGVTLNEFKVLLEQYFAINIEIDDINEFVNTSQNLPYNTKIISYKLDNKVIQINDIYEYTLPNEFITFEEELSLKISKNNKPTNNISDINEDGDSYIDPNLDPFDLPTPKKSYKEELKQKTSSPFDGW